MPEEIRQAAETLKKLLQVFSPGDRRVGEWHAIVAARDEVIRRYQDVFSDSNLPSLSEADFRGFLNFGNNRHWNHLDRLGPRICRDMPRLRRALQTLVDENRPIGARLNQLRP